MYRDIPSPIMRFMVLSSLVVLTTMSLLIHEVQGIRHSRRASSVPHEHRTAYRDEKQAFVSGPPASDEGVTFADVSLEEEETTMVATRRRRSMSSRLAANGKNKPRQQQQHHHHHWMPSIHEDYFGPRHHKAAHH